MAAPDLERRSVLFRLGVGSLALVLGEAAWATARFARAPLSYGPPLERRLGRLSDYPPGALTYEDGAKVFVRRGPDGVQAISAVCTHLGCTVRRAAQGFVGPCPGSRYDDAGRVVGGPAPSDLAHLSLKLDAAGHLHVDLGRPVDPATRLSEG